MTILRSPVERLLEDARKRLIEIGTRNRLVHTPRGSKRVRSLPRSTVELPRLMDGCGLGGFIQVIMLPFVFDWGEITESRVAAGRIVEAFDELEDGGAGLAMRSEAATIDELTLEGREETLAHRIVVGVADRAGRGRTPASLQRLPKATEVYCEPRSE